jgi:hypothetical protein
MGGFEFWGGDSISGPVELTDDCAKLLARVAIHCTPLGHAAGVGEPFAVWCPLLVAFLLGLVLSPGLDWLVVTRLRLGRAVHEQLRRLSLGAEDTAPEPPTSGVSPGPGGGTQPRQSGTGASRVRRERR